MDKKTILRSIKQNFKTIKNYNKNSKEKYIKIDNNIYCFDSENTAIFYNEEKKAWEVFDYEKEESFYKGCKKQSINYLNIFAINESVYFFRTYKEFYNFLKNIKTEYKKIIYVHNLTYDFYSVIVNIIEENNLTISDILVSDKRHLIRFTIGSLNIEFRDSLLLFNASLEKLSKNNQLYKKTHMEYNKLRTPFTILTDDEIEYAKMDVLTLYELIKNISKEYKNIKDIPLTQTGIVRRALKKNLNKYYKCDIEEYYKSVSEDMHIIERSLYTGGICHANISRVNQIIENVTIIDKGSSYPFELIAEEYPLFPFYEINKQDINLKNNHNAYIIDITIYNMTSKTNHHIQSFSKLIGVSENVLVDNGRLISCDYCRLFVNEIDLLNLQDFYNFDYKINKVWESKKFPLEDCFVKSVLDFYIEKQKIKERIKRGEDLQFFYNFNAKPKVNSLYGMCVTDYYRLNFNYKNGNFYEIQEDFKKAKEQNKPLLRYNTGIWCTSYARRELLRPIKEIDFDILHNDIIYYDTDSNELQNFEKHEKIYNKINIENSDKIKKISEEYKIDYNIISDLGQWDVEGTVDKFKTLGAKKYIIENDKNLKITVAGVPKEQALLLRNINDFKDGFNFSYKKAYKKGLKPKNISFYNDNQEIIKINDEEISQKYGVAIYPTSYNMSIIPDIKTILENMKRS